MTQYLAANGYPFEDPDAAAFKADRMSHETGQRFQVVEIDGGYAVEPEEADELADSERAPAPGHTRPNGSTHELPREADTPEDRPFVFTLRPAWRAQLTGFFLMVVGVLLVIAPTWPIAIFSMEAVYEVNQAIPGIWDDIALLGIGLFAIGAIIILAKRYWRKSVITNDGVTQSEGILIFSRVSHIDMANVHVVDVNKPNFAHILLNLGTVELSTPGSAGADVAIVDVVAPKKLATFIRERVALCKAKRFASGHH